MSKNKLIVAGIFAAVLTTGCTSTPLVVDGPIYYPNGQYHKGENRKHKNDQYKYKNNQYKNNHYKGQNNIGHAKKLAALKLESMGYHAGRLEYKQDKGIVKGKAYRNGNEYDVELSYPSMNVIKLKRD